MTNIPVLNKDVPKGLLALVLVLAAVGAATGITLAGSISGTAATEVDQAITLDDTSVTGDAVDSNLTTVSDDGTEFRTGASVNQGDSYDVKLNINNTANTSLNGRLILSADAPLQVSADGDDTVDVQRLDSETFLMKHNGTNGSAGTVTITVAAPNDIEPGFYEIQGEVVPAQA
jgi:hypothetical protein